MEKTSCKDKIIFNSRRFNNDYYSGLVDPSKSGAPSFLSNIHDNSQNVLVKKRSWKRREREVVVFTDGFVNKKKIKVYPKVEKKPPGIAQKRYGYVIKTQPKWLTELVNVETGEIHKTSEVSSFVGRKYAMINNFCGTYAAPFKARDVSLLFHTFTQVNMSNYDGISDIINPIKYRYRSIGRGLLGYVWVLEVSKNYHVHYHLATATTRLDVTRIPDELKLEGLWGRRTGVEFVKGDIASYLQKKGMMDYMSKNSHLWERFQVRRLHEDKPACERGRIGVMRMSGSSQKYLVPVHVN